MSLILRGFSRYRSRESATLTVGSRTAAGATREPSSGRAARLRRSFALPSYNFVLSLESSPSASFSFSVPVDCRRATVRDPGKRRSRRQVGFIA
jgi:hypothetical protein